MSKIVQLLDSKMYGVIGLSDDGVVYQLVNFKDHMIWMEWLPTIEGSKEIIELLSKEEK